MLHSTHKLEGHVVRTIRDDRGEVGKVLDCLFDDVSWTARYVVIHTGGRLFGRKVLVSPEFLSLEPSRGELHTTLDPERIGASPGAGEHPPVARQREQPLTSGRGRVRHPSLRNASGSMTAAPAADGRQTPTTFDRRTDPHLRSVHEVIGYHVAARDGDI